jgi:hypothetical protein
VKPRLIYIAISLALLLISFQNCSGVRFQALPLSFSQNSKTEGGNGEPYDGKLIGTFYRYVPGFTCESIPAPKSFIEISKLGSITLTENNPLQCGALVRNLQLPEIDHSIYQGDLIGYQEGIFEGFDVLPSSIPANLVQAWCRDSIDYSGIETIIHFDRVLNQSVGRVYYAIKDLSGNDQAQLISDFEISQNLFNETSFSNLNKGFELKIFRDQPAAQSGLFKAKLNVILNGTTVSRDTTCRLGSSLDPQTTQNYKMTQLRYSLNAKDNFPGDGWLDLQWDTEGDIAPTQFTLAYTLGTAEKPTSCQSGTVIPSSLITNKSYRLQNLFSNVEVKIRICALDINNQPEESKALTFSALPVAGYSQLQNLASFPADQAVFTISFINAFVGDVNHDGYADAAYLTKSNQFNIVSGFDNSKIQTLPYSAKGITREGDLNADGEDDYILNDPTINNVKIISGATGTLLRNFNGPSDSVGFGTSVASIGDMNGDGKADYLITANSLASGPGQLYVLSGADGSIIIAKKSQKTGNKLRVYNTGDFDGDGKPDYALMDGQNVSIFNSHNKLIKDLGAVLDLPNEASSNLYILGDTNQDGKSEIAIKGTHQGKDEIQIFSFVKLIDQAVSFANPYLFEDPYAMLISVGDLNHDGIADYLFSGAGLEFEVSITDGKTGNILRVINNSIGTIFARGASDFNKDGSLDVLGINKVFSIKNILGN